MISMPYNWLSTFISIPLTVPNNNKPNLLNVLTRKNYHTGICFYRPVLMKRAYYGMALSGCLSANNLQNISMIFDKKIFSRSRQCVPHKNECSPSLCF